MAEETKREDEAASCDVVIVGAGTAGLVAAYELEKAGLRTQVLEAGERIGGRLWSFPLDHKQYAEAGAEYFERDQRRVNRYIDAFGLARTRLRSDYDYALLDDHLHNFRKPDKAKLPASLAEQMPSNFYSFDLEHHYFLPLWKRALEAAAGDEDEAWDRIMEISVAEALDEAEADDVTRAYVRMRLVPDEGVELDQVPSCQLDQAAWPDDYIDELFQIEGGNIRLLEAFAESLKTPVTLHAQVTEVQQHKEGVTVCFVREGERYEIAASYAILAVPVPALRQISFSPSLPDDRRDALNAITYAPVIKVLMQFANRPWIDCGWQGELTTEHPINVWHPTVNQDGDAGILCFYATGDAAEQLCDMEEDERREFLLDILKQRELLPSDCQPTRVEFFDWPADPHSQGGWSVYPLGDEEELMELLSTPLGRCYFAGEHLPDREPNREEDDDLMDTVEAALSSGMAAAKAIVKLKAKKKKPAVRWRRAILRPAGSDEPSDASASEQEATEALRSEAPGRGEPSSDHSAAAVDVADQHVVDAIEDDSFWEVMGGKPDPMPQPKAHRSTSRPNAAQTKEPTRPTASKEPQASKEPKEPKKRTKPSASVFEIIGDKE